MLEGRYAPGFKAILHRKDLRNALQLARDAGVVVPATAAVEQLLERMCIAGRGSFDHSGLVTVIEDMAEVRVCDFPAKATHRE